MQRLASHSQSAFPGHISASKKSSAPASTSLIVLRSPLSSFTTRHGELGTVARRALARRTSWLSLVAPEFWLARLAFAHSRDREPDQNHQILEQDCFDS